MSGKAASTVLGRLAAPAAIWSLGVCFLVACRALSAPFFQIQFEHEATERTESQPGPWVTDPRYRLKLGLQTPEVQSQKSPRIAQDALARVPGADFDCGGSAPPLQRFAPPLKASKRGSEGVWEGQMSKVQESKAQSRTNPPVIDRCYRVTDRCYSREAEVWRG
jgi:hypothetical protein